MEATKFYKPTFAKLTDKELMFAQTGVGERYRRSINGEMPDVPDFDFMAPAVLQKMDRRIGLQYMNGPEDFEPGYFDMGPFQISYNFSDAVRKNTFSAKGALPSMPKGEYGAAGWSFRMLYEFLCEVYNGNTPFVDTYFQRIFKTRPVYRRFKEIYDVIQHNLDAEQFDMYMSLPVKADGTPDERRKEYKQFKDFKVWQDPIIHRDCQTIAKDIRHDIVVCLSTGRLPLRGRQGATVSRRTQKIRAELSGMVHPNRLFYASGQLIHNLNIYVEVGAGAAA